MEYFPTNAKSTTMGSTAVALPEVMLHFACNNKAWYQRTPKMCECAIKSAQQDSKFLKHLPGSDSQTHLKNIIQNFLNCSCLLFSFAAEKPLQIVPKFSSPSYLGYVTA
ncbi:hypothetical protein CDAR_99321 [Caerostris darwini]|uniref:Uncharacterized protein n=1 Tax=Caerostris darwini TaxID=1538125 RepID=A0AAV4Q2D0_9ARAC|nr:hypothetical protein CDAR_99321 [Caerostris darwini]